MATKSTQKAVTQNKFFTNVWIVTLSILIGIFVLLAAVLAGYPIFLHLLEKFTS